MNSYRIVGLNVGTTLGNSYETRHYSNKILHDEKGKGITKTHIFTKYIIYLMSDSEYYSIHLSSYHCASFGGRLCTNGSIEIKKLDSEATFSNLTHIPITQLDIKGFELKEYYEGDVFVYLDDSKTCVFKVSSDGNDERTPCGYVYVNMELFLQI